MGTEQNVYTLYEFRNSNETELLLIQVLLEDFPNWDVGAEDRAFDEMTGKLNAKLQLSKARLNFESAKLIGEGRSHPCHLLDSEPKSSEVVPIWLVWHRKFDTEFMFAIEAHEFYFFRYLRGNGGLDYNCPAKLKHVWFIA